MEEELKALRQIAWVLFTEKNMKVKNEPMKIYCPECGRKIMQWDRKSTITKSVVCKKCKKLVVWSPEDGNIRMKPVIQRTQASGTRFW